jgi:anthranilate 1,2-dioxygenase large subunit
VSAETKAEMRSFHEGFRLRDERFLDYVSEFDSPWSVTMMTVWPNLIVQREMNTLGVRHIIPNGPNSMIMQWTMFGYEEDSPEMESHRLRQGNLMGPSGFLGLEDNEALKFVQEGLRRSSTDINTIKLDSNHLGTSESLISEAAIRSLYVYYRDVMGVEVEGASE